MRTSLTVPAVLFLTACQFIPGTSAHLAEEGKEAAANSLIDPSSVQFRDVTVNGDNVCGELNGKNRMGAYVGFTRFYYGKTSKTALLDPTFEPSDLSSAQSLCDSMRGNSYSSASSTASACERAQEEIMKQAMQPAFNALWKGCKGP